MSPPAANVVTLCKYCGAPQDAEFTVTTNDGCTFAVRGMGQLLQSFKTWTDWWLARFNLRAVPEDDHEGHIY